MKKKLFLVIIYNFIALFVFNLSSYIYRTSQLKNPKTGQRVLLYSDLHDGPNFIMSKNLDQKQLILSEINKIIDNPDYAIITENFGSFVTELLECYKIKSFKTYKKFIKRAPVFWDLITNYKSKIISGDNLRYSSTCYEEADNLGAVISKLKYKRFWRALGITSEVYKSLNYSEFACKIKNLSYMQFQDYKVDLFCRLRKDISKCFREVKLNFRSNSGDNIELYNNILKLILKVERSIKVGNLQSYINAYNKICDIEMLLHIYNLNNKKNIIVFAGGLHTSNIEALLLNSGYKDEISSGLRFKGYQCDMNISSLFDLFLCLNLYYQDKFDKNKYFKLIKIKKLKNLALKLYFKHIFCVKKDIKHITTLKKESFSFISKEN